MTNIVVSQVIDGLSLAAAQTNAFDTTFRNAVASAMNVDPGNVVVVSIGAGSAGGTTASTTTTLATTTTTTTTATSPSTSTITATNINRNNWQIRQPIAATSMVILNNSNNRYPDNAGFTDVNPWENYDRIGGTEVYDNQHGVSWIDQTVSYTKSSRERSLQSSSSSSGGGSSTSSSISITYNVLIVSASAAAGISLLGTSILSGAFSAFLQTGGFPTATCTTIPSTYSIVPTASPTGDLLGSYPYVYSRN